MKRNLIALFLTLILTFAFSVNCFALPSPTETVITPSTEAQTVKIKPVYPDDSNHSWTKGDDKGLTFEVTVKVSKKTKFYVDGKVLDASDYTISEDGKKITLSPSFLASLSAGEHSISIETADGRTDVASFTVSDDGQVTVKPNDGSISPQTADNSNYLLFGSLLLIIGSCLVAMAYNKKRITR